MPITAHRTNNSNYEDTCHRLRLLSHRGMDPALRAFGPPARLHHPEAVAGSVDLRVGRLVAGVPGPQRHGAPVDPAPARLVPDERTGGHGGQGLLHGTGVP